jgi:hypothetical protein
MPLIQRRERQVEPTIGGGERVQLPSPDTGIEAELIGEIGRTITGVAERGMQVEAARKKEAAKALQKQQKERDEALATKAYNDYLNVAADHDNDLMTRVGFDAANISTDMSSQIEPEYKRITQELENDSQRYLFEANVASYSLSRKIRYNTYERNELGKAKQKESNVIIANSQSSAIENYTDPNATKKFLSDLETFTEFAMPGAGPEEKKQFKARVISDLHKGKVNRYLEDDDIDGANGYFNAVQDKILPDDRLALKNNLERNDTIESAQKLVDAVAAEFTTASERKQQIRELSEGEERKEAMRIMDARIQDDERHAKQQHDNFMSGKIREIRAVATLNEALKIANSAQLDKDKTTLEDYAKKFFNEKDNKETITTDPKVLNDLYTAIDNNEITTPEMIFEFSAGKDIKGADVTKSIEFMKRGGTVGEISFASFKTLYTGTTGEKPEDDYDQFNRVYDFVIEKVKETGSTADIRKYISNAITEGELEKGQGRIKIRTDLDYLEAFNTGQLDKWLPDIADDREREKIKTDLKILGYVTDNDTFIKLYKKSEIMGIALTEEEKFTVKQLKAQIGKMIKVTK